jgi:hypothetical protein
VNAQDTYRKCVEFEEQAATVYLQMAARFSLENGELSQLWLELGMQEKQHAGLLQFCLLEGMTTPSESVRFDTIQAELQALGRRAADPLLSVQGAFQIAIALETSEVNNVYRYLTTPLHSSMYLLRRKIMTTTPDHTYRLLLAGRKHGVPENSLKILERSTRALSPWKLKNLS